MKATTLLPLLTGAAALPSSHEQTALRSSHGQTTHRIPTSYESAILARRILALTPLGTLSTIFPSDSKNNAISPKENRPDGLGGMPHGLLEYISDCEPNSAGNPSILALNIETTFKNVAAGSNISLAVTWTPPHPPARTHAHHRKSHHHKKSSWLSWFGFGSSPSHDRHHHTEGKEEDPKPEPKPLPYSPAALPRFSLLGYIEPIPDGDDRSTEIGKELAECFTKHHPDAKWWLPGNRIHESHFVRLVVEQVYWIGGFGDRAYIGWIPVEEWRKVTKEEWESVRLPGEKKGWREWSSRGDL